MGGYGSGQHLRSPYYRYTTKDCLEFQLGYLEIRKAVDEPDYHKYWSKIEFYKSDKLMFTTKAFIKKYAEDNYLTIGTSRYKSEIYIISKPTGNGGTRPMMFCPGCGDKKLKLFLKPPRYDGWACLRCHDLTHVSSKESCKPGGFEYILAASCGCSVREVRKAFNELGQSRYDGDYLIETIHENE